MAEASDKIKVPLQRKNKILEEWHIVAKIAQGTFSNISKVVNKSFVTDQKCLKVVKTTGDVSDAELDVLRTSYNIIGKTSHRHIVRMRDRFDASDGIYMIFDLVRGGTLFQRIAKDGVFSEQLAAKMLYQVSSALEYLHANDIMYRDLKAEHVLLTEKDDSFDCVLSGSDVVVESKTPISSYAGTPGYVAPEVLKREPFHCPIDMWALGCTLFIALGGYPPFDSGSDTVRDIHRKCIAGDYNFDTDVWSGISDGAKKIIKNLLEIDFKKRLTATQVLNNHWLKNLYTPPF